LGELLKEMDLRVTVKLPDGMIVENVCLIGEDVAYFKKKIREICTKVVQVEEEIRKKIESGGRKVLRG
jgi:hypothetical protein